MSGQRSTSGDSLQRARTLIDGYNLMHAIGIARPRLSAGDGELHRARTALLDLLAESLPVEDARRTVVVFDAENAPRGLPREQQVGELTVLFSTDHENADALLEELIARHSVPFAVTVVSSDHRVQRAAKRRKARAVGSEAWYEELLRHRQQRGRLLAAGEHSAQQSHADEKPSGRANDPETDYWLNEFASGVPDDVVEDDLPPSSGRQQPLAIDQTAARNPPSPGLPSHDARAPTRAKRDAPPALDDFLNPFPPGYADDVWAEEGLVPPAEETDQENDDEQDRKSRRKT